MRLFAMAAAEDQTGSLSLTAAGPAVLSQGTR